LSDNRTLKKEFVDGTLGKISKVLDLTLDYYGIDMVYDVDKRNKLFCEIILKTKKDLVSTEMFESILKILEFNEGLNTKQSEWLSEQIYEYHKDIFVLHYFYAVLYSYNYDAKIREKISKEHVEKFFCQANEIYKKYVNLMKIKRQET
jgi:hypothetical protein